MGACYTITETRILAVWVEDGTYETFREYVRNNYEEIEHELDKICDCEWEYDYHDFLRKEDCDLII